MSLNEEQRTIQEWVHGFAVSAMRPIAHEWDEREETPWSFIRAAADTGIYSFDFFANAYADPTGLTLMVALEELAWGDAGLCMSIMGSTLAVAGLLAAGTPEQQMEWIPACFGTPSDPQVAAFCVSEADAGSDVSSLRTRAGYDEATDEWVLDGTKTWITNGGIAAVHVVVATVDPSLGSRGQASFVVPAGTPGLRMGRKFQKMGIRASHTAEVVLEGCRVTYCSAAKSNSTNASRELERGSAPPSKRPWRRLNSRVPPLAPRPSVLPARRTSTRWTTPRSASNSVGQLLRTSPSHSPWPIWRFLLRALGYSSGERRGWPRNDFRLPRAKAQWRNWRRARLPSA
jgi:hypothetical protein